jgi:hypothetical protein
MFSISAQHALKCVRNSSALAFLSGSRTIAFRVRYRTRAIESGLSSDLKRPVDAGYSVAKVRPFQRSGLSNQSQTRSALSLPPSRPSGHSVPPRRHQNERAAGRPGDFWSYCHALPSLALAWVEARFGRWPLVAHAPSSSSVVARRMCLLKKTSIRSACAKRYAQRPPLRSCRDFPRRASRPGSLHHVRHH